MIGSGLGRQGAFVRWRTAGLIALGWCLTLPAAATVGGLAAFITALGSQGVLVTATCGLAAVGWMFLLSRREPVSHRNVVEVEEASETVKFRSRRRQPER